MEVATEGEVEGRWGGSHERRSGRERMEWSRQPEQ